MIAGSLFRIRSMIKARISRLKITILFVVNYSLEMEYLLHMSIIVDYHNLVSGEFGTSRLVIFSRDIRALIMLLIRKREPGRPGGVEISGVFGRLPYHWRGFILKNHDFVLSELLSQ
jgi:hypothetical protein